jgi:hypothetical protein
MFGTSVTADVAHRFHRKGRKERKDSSVFACARDYTSRSVSFGHIQRISCAYPMPVFVPSVIRSLILANTMQCEVSLVAHSRESV